MIAVVVRTRDGARAAEALRAAVGLTLRGERVAVVRGVALDEADLKVKRCLATLTALGHDVDAPWSAVRAARVVEVWT